jgi:hypothetical protein
MGAETRFTTRKKQLSYQNSLNAEGCQLQIALNGCRSSLTKKKVFALTMLGGKITGGDDYHERRLGHPGRLTQEDIHL